MICTCFDGLDEIYLREKFGEDRTSRAGCRSENMVFVCFCKFFLSRSEADAPLFQKGLLFQVHYTVLVLVARWHHKSREIAVKIFEKYQNLRKKLCARLRTDS